MQVTMTMLPENTYKREVGSLKAIRDSHPKTVLSMDSFVTELPDGLKHYNLLDWLTGTY